MLQGHLKRETPPAVRFAHTRLSGWKFDDGCWVDESSLAHDFVLPNVSEIDTSLIPGEFYLDRPEGETSLELTDIRTEDQTWAPGVRSGAVRIYGTSSVVTGNNCVMLVVGDEVDDAGRSIVRIPHIRSGNFGLLHSVSFTRLQDGVRAPNAPFFYVPSLSGTCINGIELDGDQAGQEDRTQREFTVAEDSIERTETIVRGDNASEEEFKWKILIGEKFSLSFKPTFSMPWIFRRELTIEEYDEKENAGELDDGDYCVGYTGTWAEGTGIKLYSMVQDLTLGAVSWLDNTGYVITYNQPAFRDRESETLTYVPGNNYYNLTSLPILDSTRYEEPDGTGQVLLDTWSTVVTINGQVWGRVDSFEECDGSEHFYILDSLKGTIRFGTGIDGEPAMPFDETGTFTVSYIPTQLLVISREGDIFFDETENLDPLKKILRSGYIVLDDDPVEPGAVVIRDAAPNITLDGECYDGSLLSPPYSDDSIINIRARVLSRGDMRVGVPNISVRFHSETGSIAFSSDASITDEDGYAYTQASATSNLSRIFTRTERYLPYEGNLSPIQLDPSNLDINIPEYGHIIPSANKLVVPGRLKGALNSIYVLLTSIQAKDDPDNFGGRPELPSLAVVPYNAATRRGGISTVWYAEGASRTIVHPTAMEWDEGRDVTTLTFAVAVPTKKLITAYTVVSGKVDRIWAEIDGPLISNKLKYVCTPRPEVVGMHRLPTLRGEDSDQFSVDPEAEQLQSSAIGRGTYFDPSSIRITGVRTMAMVFTNEMVMGGSYYIVGTGFPTTEDLRPSLFISLIDDKVIVSAMDISSSLVFDSDTRMKIESLPIIPFVEDQAKCLVSLTEVLDETIIDGRKTSILVTIKES